MHSRWSSPGISRSSLTGALAVAAMAMWTPAVAAGPLGAAVADGLERPASLVERTQSLKCRTVWGIPQCTISFGKSSDGEKKWSKSKPSKSNWDDDDDRPVKKKKSKTFDDDDEPPKKKKSSSDFAEDTPKSKPTGGGGGGGGGGTGGGTGGGNKCCVDSKGQQHCGSGHRQKCAN